MDGESVTWKPHFDLLHKGDWPYTWCEGVGLKLSTVVNFDHAAVVAVFEGFGCPRDLAYKVAGLVRDTGEHTTTVMATLDFDRLAAKLSVLGILVEIVPPRGWGVAGWV